MVAALRGKSGADQACRRLERGTMRALGVMRESGASGFVRIFCHEKRPAWKGRALLATE
jgi:hypothetical protein